MVVIVCAQLLTPNTPYSYFLSFAIAVAIAILPCPLLTHSLTISTAPHSPRSAIAFPFIYLVLEVCWFTVQFHLLFTHLFLSFFILNQFVLCIIISSSSNVVFFLCWFLDHLIMYFFSLIWFVHFAYHTRDAASSLRCVVFCVIWLAQNVIRWCVLPPQNVSIWFLHLLHVMLSYALVWCCSFFPLLTPPMNHSLHLSFATCECDHLSVHVIFGCFTLHVWTFLPFPTRLFVLHVHILSW